MTAEKDVQVARKKGRGRGGEVIWAMPERKHSFSNEVFPYSFLFPQIRITRFSELLILRRRGCFSFEQKKRFALLGDHVSPWSGGEEGNIVAKSETIFTYLNL